VLVGARTLRGVALGAGDAPKAPVKVTARLEVRDGARAVEAVERAEERKSRHGAVEEARIGLAKCVACKDARGLLQAQDDCQWSRGRCKRTHGDEGRGRTVDHAWCVDAP
jgi:hypothetical protein